MKKQYLFPVLVLLIVLIGSVIGACASKDGGSSSDPIILGALGSEGYAVGRDGVRSAEMAIDEINATGGITVNGEKRLLKLVSMDSRAMAPGVATSDCILAYEKLILEQDPVAIVVSAERSEVALASMDIVAKYEIPQIIPSAKSPAITAKVTEDYDTYKYNFRLTVDAIILAQGTAAPIISLGERYGFNKVFFVNENAAWAVGTNGAIQKMLEAEGWQTVGSETVPLGVSEFNTTLLQAKSAGAQVICIMFSNPEGGALIEQASTMKLPAVIIGMSSPTIDPKAWDTYGGNVEYAMLAVAEAGNVPVPMAPNSVKYYDDFVAKYGEAPGSDSVPSPCYDSVWIVANAIERANSLDGDAIVAALEETDWEGAIGRIRFDEKHQVIYGDDPKETAVSVFIQWQSPGERAIVWPGPAADSDIQLPPWVTPVK